MKYYKRKLTLVFLGVLAFYIATFLIYVFLQENQLMIEPNKLQKIEFVGDFYTESNQTKNPLNKNSVLDEKINGKIILNGHFNQEIMNGQNLLFRLQNIRVKIYQNGELIYSHGHLGSYPLLTQSSGNEWDSFTAPNISSKDMIKIELQSAYRNNIATAYEDFLNQIVAGDSGTLFCLLLQKIGFTVFLGGMIFLMGSLLLLATGILKILKTHISSKVYYFAMFAVVSGLWFFLDFQIISLIIPFGVFTNILSMVCLCLMGPLLGLYVLQFVESNAGIPLLVMVYSSLAFTLFYLITQCMGIFDGFDLLIPLIVFMILTFLSILFVLCYETVRNRNIHTCFLFFSICVLFLSCFDIKNYLFNFTSDYFMAKISYIIFISAHFLYMIYCLQRNLKGLSMVEDELAQSRIAIAISQIQPHFLYNALTAIKQLCAIDPKRAEQAVGDFSCFLRGNLDSITSRALIPFEKELNHIKNYLALEQLRFGKRLRVQYDIQTSDFSLPSLTVQPLVENAVRYGVTKRMNGGTVSITTRESSTGVIITVWDDGVGFNPNLKKEDDRSHIGIDNVRDRLRAQCGGLLFIESSLDNGTIATILIDKGELEK